MQKILIVIDSFKREFSGVTFLKRELKKNGFKVFTCSRFNLLLSYNRILPHIVILPKTHKILGLDQIYKNSYVVLMGAESFSGAREALIACARSKAAGGWQDSLVDLVACWGEFNKRVYSEIGVFKNATIAATGHPMTESWYQKKYLRKNDHKKIIGISLSLRTITHSMAPPIVQTVCDTERDKLLYDSGYHAESWLLYEITWLRIVTNLIEELSSEYEIQLRPHPLEDKSQYDYFSKIYPNISVHADEDIISWCDGIDVLLSYMSTSQVDAYVRGVNVISIKDLFPDFVLNGIPNMMKIEMNDFFYSCVDMENLKSMIKENTSNKNPKIDGFLLDVFNYPSENRPSVNIANLIVNFFSKKPRYKNKKITPIPLDGIFKHVPSFLFPDYLFIMLAHTRNILGKGFDPTFSYCAHTFLKNRKVEKQTSSLDF